MFTILPKKGISLGLGDRIGIATTCYIDLFSYKGCKKIQLLSCFRTTKH